MDSRSDSGLRWIEPEDLGASFLPEPFPPRGGGAALGPLVRSIREIGLLSPIVARPRQGKLQVVCGYRRLLAAQAAGAPTVPVLVRDLNDDECRRAFADDNRAGPGAAQDTARRTADWTAGGGPEIRSGADSTPGTRRGAPVARAVAADIGLGLLSRRLDACFRTIAGSRTVPVDEIEGITSDLIELDRRHEGRALRPRGGPGDGDWIAGHSLLVAGLALRLAESLDWQPGQVKKLVLACLLHDAGMLFVPRKILRAPRALTPAERREVARHPDAGREAIQRAGAWGAQVHLIAQDHHERWNGSGYPRGKTGREVDLPSRMVAFLDTFAALISWRPFRGPLLAGEALEAMTTLTARGLYDPAILAHFRNVLGGGSLDHLPRAARRRPSMAAGESGNLQPPQRIRISPERDAGPLPTSPASSNSVED